jgi:LmbE family N-acetylglucosaminyl deacetylase
MLTLELAGDPTTPLDVLCIGAHADDIEIGCGATLLELARAERGLVCHLVVLSGEGARGEEARRAAATLGADCKEIDLRVASMRESYFPYIGAEVKAYIHDLATQVSPDLIFTHHLHDLHQDHRLVAELVGNDFRDHLVLGFEIPKYDGDLGNPNVFVPIDAETCARKIELLMDSFESQRVKDWFTEETFRALLRLRGVESRSPTGYAEAFFVRKLALSTSSVRESQRP